MSCLKRESPAHRVVAWTAVPPPCPMPARGKDGHSTALSARNCQSGVKKRVKMVADSRGRHAAPARYQRSSSLRGLQATHEAHSIRVAQPNRKLNGSVQPSLTVCSQPTRKGPRQLKL